MILWLIRYRHIVTIGAAILMVVGGVAYVSHLQKMVRLRTEERDKAYQVADEYLTALKAEKASNEKKITALEKEATDVQNRNDRLLRQIKAINDDQEEITCPVPLMLRNVISLPARSASG